LRPFLAIFPQGFAVSAGGQCLWALSVRLSPAAKIPFPRQGGEGAEGAKVAARKRLERCISKTEALARIKAEVVELAIPIGVWIPQARDIDPAWEASFDRCLDELGSEECE